MGAKVKAAEVLLQCTDHLLAVYDAIPVVNGMSDYIKGNMEVFPTSETELFGIPIPIPTLTE